MKLLFVNTGDARRLYGVERWMLRVARGLQSRGHSPVMAAPRDRILHQAARGEGIPAVHFRFRTDLSPLGALRMGSILRRHGPDLVCVKGAKSARLVGLARSLAGRRRLPIVLRAGARTDVRATGLHGWTQRRFIGCCLTPSESLRDEALACSFLDPGRVVAVPNGVAAERFDPRRPERQSVRRQWGVPDAAVVLGMVGRLQARKRPDWALRVVADLAPTAGADLRLVFVGTGSLEAQLRATAAGLRLGERVRFAGYSDEVERQLQGMDLLLSPSHSEGMPSAVLEAMATGLAVVATESGGMAEIVLPGVTGEVVGVADYARFAGAIRDLVRDAGRRDTMGRAGRERVEREFTEGRMLDRIEALFRRLVAEGGTG